MILLQQLWHQILTFFPKLFCDLGATFWARKKTSPILPFVVSHYSNSSKQVCHSVQYWVFTNKLLCKNIFCYSLISAGVGCWLISVTAVTFLEIGPKQKRNHEMVSYEIMFLRKNVCIQSSTDYSAKVSYVCIS